MKIRDNVIECDKGDFVPAEKAPPWFADSRKTYQVGRYHDREVPFEKWPPSHLQEAIQMERLVFQHAVVTVIIYGEMGPRAQIQGWLRIF